VAATQEPSSCIIDTNYPPTRSHWICNLPSPTYHPGDNLPAPYLTPDLVPYPVSDLVPRPAACVAIPSQLIADQVAFYHAVLFSPVMSTWCAAIDAGHLAVFPHLTSAQVCRHFLVSVPMHYGHMDQTRANVQSTQPRPLPPDSPDSTPDSTPAPITDRTHTLFVDLHDVTGLVHSDQTGRMPVTSVWATVI
jgi:hypothetical protein